MNSQRYWRVMGMWRDDRAFLVLVGASPRQLRAGLKKALAGYSRADRDRIDFLWIEKFDPGTTLRPPAWIPFAEIPTYGIRRAKVSHPASCAA